MLLRGRVTGQALAALAALASFLAIGCASGREATVTDRAAPSAAEAAAPAGGPVELTGMTLIPDGDSPRLLISGSSALAPTVFARDDGRKVVIDLPNTVAAAGLEPPRLPRGGESVVERLTMRSFTEMGEPHVQLELDGSAALDARLVSEAGSSATAVVLAARASARSPSAAAAEPPAPAEAVAEAPAPGALPTADPEPIRVETLAAAPAPAAPATVSSPPAAVSSPAAAADREHVVAAEAVGEAAGRLSSVTARLQGRDTVVRLGGDGAFGYEAFLLADPPRWVVDLKGVRNASAPKSREVGVGPVSRVRVSQFRSEPEPVTRIVLDLSRPDVPELVADGTGLSVVFHGEPATEPEVRAEAERPAGTISIERSSPPPAASPARTEPEVAAVTPPAAGSYEAHEADDPAEAVVPVASAAAPATTTPAPVTPAPAPEIVAASPEVRPVTPPAPARAPTAEDRALVEAAEALLAQQEAGGQTRDLGNPYEARVIGSGEKQYTGEPITLNLKDADVKDTLQKFSELTGLNIVLDPEVRGTVTVSLTDIPWDQALELILKINGLGYVLEGNVMRIASTVKLASEEATKQSLLKAQEANRPVKTVIQKLSYSRGAQLMQAIKNVMTARGDVYVETRTNSLIIKELPENIPVVLDLIKNLDTPPQQVMIEARVIEATRTFSRQVGIDWSFRSVNDTAHGNTTGLVFPNSVNLGGQVSLPSGATLLSMSLANVLDSFGIDVALSAAESRGLIKVVSSPKVQTAQLVQASIQSGFQIPVQTTVNNTTSVLYVDATLRLDVLPYITAEGTIVMDITIQKREPAVGINVAIGQNIPLVTRDAKTTLLVRDGGTAIIGGIMKLTVNNQKNMIPGLWKIPLLGYLFQNNNDREDTDELMIFITPRIMKNS